ncbi:hypothetical protein SLH49_16825 [Cognatiyoonia sp. IB215446]|uniref:hypothetical protein n=1 Tax=Cognatiyoonia sp. IB215446 TaxID=3097355 RepID=UPI002A180283|nr:hypothetical protein [Cognatiyoonia sp. IB215446]MDX8349650.1 hypothetical protein [Cognatiyoonia sp. IB215446]
MTELDERGQLAPDDAQTRIGELADLFRSLRTTVRLAIAQMGSPDAQTPKATLSKLNELQSVHFKLLEAEEAFYARQEKGDDTADIDFDAIRAEIGCQLDRLRKALPTE